MTKSLFTIISITFLTTQIAFATCATSNIPGHYTDRYIDNNDGTITDKMTNLMWMKCDIDTLWDPVNKTCQLEEEISGTVSPLKRKLYNWQEALMETNNFNLNGFAGKQDWRLPNIKELASLLEPGCLSSSHINAIDTSFFSTPANNYWSSTPFPNATQNVPSINQAWIVIFRYNSSQMGVYFTDIEQKLSARLVANNTK